MSYIIFILILLYSVVCTDFNIIESYERNHFYSFRLRQRYANLSISSYNIYNKMDSGSISPKDVICFTNPQTMSVMENKNAIYFYPFFISGMTSPSFMIYQSIKFKSLLREDIHVDKLIILSEETNLYKNEVINLLKSYSIQEKIHCFVYDTFTNIYDVRKAENPTKTSIILDLFIDLKESYKMINLKSKLKIRNKYYRLFPIPEYDYQYLDEDDENGVYMLYNYINEKYIIQPTDFYLNEMLKFIDLYITNKLAKEYNEKSITNQFSILHFVKIHNNQTVFENIYNIYINDDNGDLINSKTIKQTDDNIKHLLLLTQIKNEEYLKEEYETDLISEFKSQVKSLNDISDDNIIYKPLIMHINTVNDCINTLIEYYNNESEILLIVNGNSSCYNEILLYKNHNDDKMVWLSGIITNQISNEVSNIYYSGVEQNSIYYILFKYILLNYNYNYRNNTYIINEQDNDDNMFEWFDEFSLDKSNECKIKSKTDINRCVENIEMKYENNDEEEDDDHDILIVLNINSIDIMKRIINNLNENNNFTFLSLNPMIEYDEIIQFENINFISLFNMEESSKYSVIKSNHLSYEIILMMNIFKNLIIKNELSNFKFRLRYDKFVYKDKEGYENVQQIDVNNFIDNKIYICKYIKNENIVCEESNYVKTLSKNKYENNNNNIHHVGGFFDFNRVEDISLLFVYLQFIDSFNVENKFNYFYPVIYNINNTISTSEFVTKYFNLIQNNNNMVFIFLGNEPNNMLYLNNYIINNGSEIMHLYSNVINTYNYSENILQSGVSMLGIWWFIYRDITKYPFNYISLILDSVYNNNIYFVEYLSLFSKLLPIHIYYYYYYDKVKKKNDFKLLLNDCISSNLCVVVNVLNKENSLLFYEYINNNNIKLSYHQEITVYDIQINENFIFKSELNKVKNVIPTGILTVSNYFTSLLNYSNNNSENNEKTKFSFYSNNFDFLNFISSTVNKDYKPNHLTESFYNGLNSWKSSVMKTSSFNPKIISSYSMYQQSQSPSGMTRKTEYNTFESNLYLSEIEDVDNFNIIDQIRFSPDLNYFVYFNLLDNNYLYCNIKENEEIKFKISSNIHIGVILDSRNRYFSQSILYYVETVLIELNNYKSNIKVSIYPYLLTHKDLEDGKELSNMFNDNKIKLFYGCITQYCYYKLLPYIEKEEKIFVTIYKPFKTECKKNIFYIQQSEYNLIPAVLNYYKMINYTKLYYLYDENDSISIKEIEGIYKSSCLAYNMNISFIKYDDNNSFIFQELLKEKQHVGILISLKENSLIEFTRNSKLLKLSPFQFSFFLLYSIITGYEQNGNISDNSNIITLLPQTMIETNNNPLKNIVEISLKYIISAYELYEKNIQNKNYKASQEDKDYLIKSFETIEFGNSNNKNNYNNDKVKGSISHILTLNYNYVEIKSDTILYYEDPIAINTNLNEIDDDCFSTDIKSYYHLSISYYIVFFAFHIVYIIFILAFIIFVYKFRKTKIIKASSCNMMIYIGIAFYNSILASYLWYFIRYSDFTCSFFTSYWIIGMQNIISALDLKTWRIDKLLYNPLLKKFHITDYYVFTILFFSLFGHIIIDIIWYLNEPYSKYNERLIIEDSSSIESVYFRSCSFSSIYVAIHLLYVVLFYIYGLYESWRTIEVDKEFNESQSLSTIVASLSYASVTMLLIYNYTYNDPIAIGLLLMIIYPISLIISEIILWFPKFYYLYDIGFDSNNLCNMTRNTKANITTKDNNNNNRVSYNITNLTQTDVRSHRSSVHCHVFQTGEDAAAAYLARSSRKPTYTGDEMLYGMPSINQLNINGSSGNNGNANNNNNSGTSGNGINGGINMNCRRRVSSYGRIPYGGGYSNEFGLLASTSGYACKNGTYSLGGGLLAPGLSLNDTSINKKIRPLISGNTKIIIPLPGSTTAIGDNISPATLISPSAAPVNGNGKTNTFFSDSDIENK